MLKATVRHPGKGPAPYFERTSQGTKQRRGVNKGGPRILAHFHDARMAARGPDYFDQLDRYVDTALAGGNADRAVPGMRAHLIGCPACAEDHDSLLAYVRRSDDGISPET